MPDKQGEKKQKNTLQNTPVTHTIAPYAAQNTWWARRDACLNNIASYTNYASPYNGR